MDQPLVSVICLCYNHESFVREAIESVFAQSYQNLQIIIVDDASTDSSATIIEQIISSSQRLIEFIRIKNNIGNCAAFNCGLARASGEYVIDFATDDVMMPDRISKQIEFFQHTDESYGVVFTDAMYIDRRGVTFRNHYDYLLRKGLIHHIPQGDVYADVLSTYFISAPTMMVRKKVFDALQGYDETLAYEDFDFWVRSSRQYRYGFLNEKLTKVRKTKSSMSSKLYVPGDPQLHSTYLVCEKAFVLNRSEKDETALAKRVRYELRTAVFSQNYQEAKLFFDLLQRLHRARTIDRMLLLLNSLRLPLSSLWKLYQKIRFGK